MSNEKHYPLHPNQSHPPIMTCEIPLEEYESLKRENAELKAKLENVQATAYTESVDAGMENRRLKRALWMARAAMCRTYDIRAYFIENPDSKRRFIEFFVLMQKAAATAAIKAEEYK